MGKYDLTSYKKDLETAEAEYNAVIIAGCTGAAGISALDSHQIYELKAHARGIKNQMVGAAGKRLRSAIALKMLDALAKKFDLTTTLAVRITEHLLGRAIDRNVLLKRYGTKGRTASDKSEDFAILDKIISHQIFVEAEKELGRNLEAAAEMRKSKANLATAKKALGQKTPAQLILSKAAKAGKQI